MEITLEEEQVALLAAVADGRVHMDPRFTRPDFERPAGSGGNAHDLRRATGRLRPLREARLVELADEADQDGVTLYRLTGRGRGVLALAQLALAQAEAEATAETAGTVTR